MSSAYILKSIYALANASSSGYSIHIAISTSPDAGNYQDAQNIGHTQTRPFTSLQCSRVCGDCCLTAFSSAILCQATTAIISKLLRRRKKFLPDLGTQVGRFLLTSWRFWHMVLQNHDCLRNRLSYESRFRLLLLVSSCFLFPVIEP